jgi:hypothetical protein
MTSCPCILRPWTFRLQNLCLKDTANDVPEIILSGAQRSENVKIGHVTYNGTL